MFAAANQRHPLNGDRLVASTGLTGFGGRQLYKLGFAQTDVQFGFTASMGEAMGADYTVVSAAMEYNGAFVPLNFGGQRSKVVTAAESAPLVLTDKLTAAQLQAAFGVPALPRDAEVYLRYEVAAAEAQSLPGRIDGNGDAAIPGQVCYRFPAGGFGNVVDAAGAMSTPAGGARAPTGNGSSSYGTLATWMLAVPTEAGAVSVIAIGDSIARGLADDVPVVITGGGYISRAATGTGGTLAMALQGNSGEQLDDWLKNSAYRRQFLQFANVLINQHNTNDINVSSSGQTLATIQANQLALWAMARQAGIERIVVPKVGVRGDDELPASRWGPGQLRDQVDAWLATKLGAADGFDLLSDVRSPIANPLDDHLARRYIDSGAQSAAIWDATGSFLHM